MQAQLLIKSEKGNNNVTYYKYPHSRPGHISVGRRLRELFKGMGNLSVFLDIEKKYA